MTLKDITDEECPCDVRYLDFGFVCRGTARSVDDRGWVLVWRDEDGSLDPESGMQGMRMPLSQVIRATEPWPEEWDVVGVQNPDGILRPIDEDGR